FVSNRPTSTEIYTLSLHDALPIWDLNDPDINNWNGVFTNEDGNVTQLRLEYNQLTAIPTEIGQLVNLIYLRLNNNELTSIPAEIDRKSTRLNSSHVKISYAVFCLK